MTSPVPELLLAVAVWFQEWNEQTEVVPLVPGYFAAFHRLLWT